MPLLIDTTSEHGLPTADLLLFALPGVGDVGKNHNHDLFVVFEGP